MKTAAKDFKMTELGPIPEDWEVKRLGEVAKRRKYSACSSARGEVAHAENAENAEGGVGVGEGISATSALSARGKKAHAENAENTEGWAGVGEGISARGEKSHAENAENAEGRGGVGEEISAPPARGRSRTRGERGEE